MIDAYGLAVSSALNAIYMAERMWSGLTGTASSANPFGNALKQNIQATKVEQDAAQQISRAAIEQARELCDKMSWPDALPEIARLENSLKFLPVPPTAANNFRHLANTFRDKLATEYFYRVGRSDVALYGKGDLFGPLVAQKFNLAGDIKGAGDCLALGQSTACVFHLMRIMEVALHRLGRVLKVKFDPTKQSWFQICNDATKAAVNRPAKTARQRSRNAALGAAASHLQTVRLAWRNEVMHPQQTYTQEQAREVFNAVRTFMIDLAGLV